MNYRADLLQVQNTYHGLSPAIRILVLISLMLSACQTDHSSKVVDQTKPDTGIVTVTRFFHDSSFWNQPIGPDPEIDPNTEKWIKMLEQEPTGENFSTIYSKWTVPVYEADEGTPMVEVAVRALNAEAKKVWRPINNKTHYSQGPQFNPVPLPAGTTPDKESDAHYAVVDWKRMVAWDMWGLSKKEDGSWESKTGMFYRLDGDGTFNSYELGYVDGESVHFHGPSRASGVPAIAGLIRYDEVMSGRIRHKLSCATRFAAKQTYVYPASWTDGFIQGGIPEGAVIQLDPELDLSQFDLTPEEKMIALALKEYGMVVVDIAQGQPIYAEGLWGHPDKSWEGKLREWEDRGINSIPYSHYRVLKVENPVQRGDSHTQRPEFLEEWLPESMKKN